MPVEKYSRAPEILAHSRAIGEKVRSLQATRCFQTEVTELRWDEASSRWIVSTNRGDAMKARFVVMANGPLHRPKLPGIPGVETLQGPFLPHQPLGLSPTPAATRIGGLTGLKDKRVGIIGTGATAVQCVPHLGAWAKELYVFQRTPSSIDVRANRPTDPDWAQSRSSRAGSRSAWTISTSSSPAASQDEDLVNDGWTDIIGNLLFLRDAQAADEAAQKPPIWPS